MYSIPLFYIFFCVLAISSIWIIVMRWKRYMKYSNGTYKNAGQNLIFKTELSQNEIIRKLETHDASVFVVEISACTSPPGVPTPPATVTP